AELRRVISRWLDFCALPSLASRADSVMMRRRFRPPNRRGIQAIRSRICTGRRSRLRTAGSSELHVGEMSVSRIAVDLLFVVLWLPQDPCIDEFVAGAMSRGTGHAVLSRHRVDGHDRFLCKSLEDLEDAGAGSRLCRRLSDCASIIEEV